MLKLKIQALIPLLLTQLSTYILGILLIILICLTCKPRGYITDIKICFIHGPEKNNAKTNNVFIVSPLSGPFVTNSAC